MAYKDPKVQKEYQHNWYLRKKAGTETKTKPILSQEVKNERKRTLKNMQNRIIRQRKGKIIGDKIGNKCFFCGYVTRLQTHRKDGTEHTSLPNMSKKDMISELSKNSNEYVRLCYKCHKSVHWCMIYLGLSWEQIAERRQPR